MTTPAEKNAKVLAVLNNASEPIGPTEIADRISESWCSFDPGRRGGGQSAPITPVLRRIGAVRHRGGKYTKPEQQAEISRQGADALAYAVHATAKLNKISDTASKLIAAGAPMYRLLEKIPADNGARLTVGRINELLPPISVSVACLAELGFEPAEQVNASRLYRECDFPAICRAIADHALAAAEQIEA